MKKHFGDGVSDTVGVRNIKHRIAATENPGVVHETDSTTANDIKHISNTKTEVKIHCTYTETDTPIPDDTTKSNINYTMEEINVPLSSNINSELSESFVSTCDGDVNTQNLSSSVIDSDTDVYSSCIQSFEDKFNPDNLKIRNPLPYNIWDNAMLDSSFFQQAANVLNKAKTNSLNNSPEETNDQTSFRHDSFFLNMFINRSVTIPVGAQNRMVNSALLHYFIVEKRLFQHVEALNSYLCLQNGLFGHFLTNLLIQEVKNKGFTSKEDIPSKSGRLNEILGEAVALSAESSDRSDFRDNLGFILLREHNRNSMDLDTHQKVKNKSVKSNYEVLDNITLNYSVEWPLSILLTDDLLINYEKLFTFLMRLYRAELLLLGLSSILKFRGGNSRQLAALHHYRYRMLHFVRTVRHYVNVTVIHCAWTDLATSFHKMNSLDRIYEGLVRHIKFVTTNCLLGTKGESVKKLLVDQLIVIECFCAEVEAYSQSLGVPGAEKNCDQRFANLDKIFKAWKQIQAVFVDVFFKLASRGTYQKVSYFLQLFNFNGYFGNSAINNTSPDS